MNNNRCPICGEYHSGEPYCKVCGWEYKIFFTSVPKRYIEQEDKRIEVARSQWLTRERESQRELKDRIGELENLCDTYRGMISAKDLEIATLRSKISRIQLDREEKVDRVSNFSIVERVKCGEITLLLYGNSCTLPIYCGDNNYGYGKSLSYSYQEIPLGNPDMEWLLFSIKEDNGTFKLINNCGITRDDKGDTISADGVEIKVGTTFTIGELVIIFKKIL